jgi:hypothetical protein
MDELKKNLINIINYTINKKMNIQNSKLDYIIEKVDYNLKLTLVIMENLKNNYNINNEDFDNNLKCLKKMNLELKKNIKDDVNEDNIIIEKEDEVIDMKENEVIDVKENEVIDMKENEVIDMKENEVIDVKENEVIDVKENEVIIEKEIIKENIKKKNLNKKNTDEVIVKYKDIKNEYFDIDNEFIKNCLNNTNINGDIKLFKKMYIDKISKEYYPLRHIKKKFQYWLDDHMVDDDSNGSYIKNTILRNISECYLRVNTYENYSNNIEQFLSNQDHINKLMEEKYKDKFLNKLVTIIDL